GGGVEERSICNGLPMGLWCRGAIRFHGRGEEARASLGQKVAFRVDVSPCAGAATALAPLCGRQSVVHFACARSMVVRCACLNNNDIILVSWEANLSLK